MRKQDLIKQLEVDLDKLNKKRDKAVAEIDAEIEYTERMLSAARARTNGTAQAKARGNGQWRGKVPNKGDLAPYLYAVMGEYETLDLDELEVLVDEGKKKGKLKKVYSRDVIGSTLSQYNCFTRVGRGEYKLG